MTRFYLSMECHRCEGDMFLGPVATTITHNGLPVVPYDFASQESFSCENCGTEHILGDFDYLVEGGGEGATDDKDDEWDGAERDLAAEARDIDDQHRRIWKGATR